MIYLLRVGQLKRGDKLSVEVAVTNTGDRDGAETVYWFITDPYSTITRPVKELKYFEKQTIRADHYHLKYLNLIPI